MYPFWGFNFLGVKGRKSPSARSPLTETFLYSFHTPVESDPPQPTRGITERSGNLRCGGSSSLWEAGNPHREDARPWWRGSSLSSHSSSASSRLVWILRADTPVLAWIGWTFLCRPFPLETNDRHDWEKGNKVKYVLQYLFFRHNKAYIYVHRIRSW